VWSTPAARWRMRPLTSISLAFIRPEYDPKASSILGSRGTQGTMVRICSFYRDDGSDGEMP
jgi:hypothetical protein